MVVILPFFLSKSDSPLPGDGGGDADPIRNDGSDKLDFRKFFNRSSRLSLVKLDDLRFESTFKIGGGSFPENAFVALGRPCLRLKSATLFVSDSSKSGVFREDSFKLLLLCALEAIKSTNGGVALGETLLLLPNVSLASKRDASVRSSDDFVELSFFRNSIVFSTNFVLSSSVIEAVSLLLGATDSQLVLLGDSGLFSIRKYNTNYQ